MNQFYERRDRFFSQIRARLPPTELMVGYGSGVFYQHGAKLDRMIDFICVVDDLGEFHRENLKLNPDHYGMLFPSIGFGKWRIETLNKHFFPLFYFTQNVIDGVNYKYGVIQSDELEIELKKWRNFAIAGRFHKPLLLLGDRVTHFGPAIQENRAQAVT